MESLVSNNTLTKDFYFVKFVREEIYNGNEDK